MEKKFKYCNFEGNFFCNNDDYCNDRLNKFWYNGRWLNLWGKLRKKNLVRWIIRILVWTTDILDGENSGLYGTKFLLFLFWSIFLYFLEIRTKSSSSNLDQIKLWRLLVLKHAEIVPSIFWWRHHDVIIKILSWEKLNFLDLNFVFLVSSMVNDSFCAVSHCRLVAAN